AFVDLQVAFVDFGFGENGFLESQVAFVDLQVAFVDFGFGESVFAERKRRRWMFVVGLDIGYGNLKVVSGFAEKKPMQVQVLPAGAAPLSAASRDIRGQLTSGVLVLLDDAQYVAGIEPEILCWTRALHEDYPTSPEYRALFHAALLGTEQTVVDRLVTGLPVSHFKDARKVDDLVRRMVGTHRVLNDHSITVREVQVLPQPIGSYLDVTAGREDEFEEAEVLVVDPGFFSVDWVYLSGTTVRQEWSGSSTTATSMLLEAACANIRESHGFAVSVDKLERLIRAGRKAFRIPGGVVEIGAAVHRAAATLGPALVNEIKMSLRSRAQDISFIVLTGGGATYYERAMREIFPHAEVVLPKNSVTSNALGFWWYGVD
ncbi:MAG: ParM/StbA family protein, partial [Desulfuromonas thiophila]|nr:ParM/StbA family protein [Desulfuromonas thiophila]